MKRSVRLWLLLLTIVLSSFCGLFLGTGIGLGVAQKAVHLLSGGRIDIGTVEGKLFGRFDLGQIHINLPGVDIRAERIAGDWSPGRLLQGELHIAAVDIQGVVVTFGDGPATPSAGGPVRLPVLLLPLDLRLDRFTLTALQLRDSDGSELLLFDSIEVRLRGKDGLIDIDNISIQGPEMGVAVHGSLDFARNWHVDMLGHWRLVNYGFHQLEGTLSASGPLDSPHAALGVNIPADIRVEGDVVNLFDSPEWTATLEARDVDLAALIKHCPKIDLATVSGQLHGNTSGYEGLVQAVGTWDTVENMRLKSDIRGGLMGIDFAALRIDQGDGWAVAENAKINWRHIFDWEGLFHFHNFDPALFFEALPGRLDADLTSVGTVRDDLGVDVAFEIFQAQGTIRDRPISAKGKVALTENDVRSEGLTVRSGEVDGVAVIENGMISWADQVSWSGEVQLDNFDPSGLYPDFPGHISGQVSGQGQFGPSGGDGYIKISDIRGNLRGNPLAGSGEIRLVGGAIQSPGLHLESGPSRLVVQGQAGDAFALDFTFSSSDLGSLVPETAGSLHILGKLRGSHQAPQFEVEMRGTEMAYKEYSLGLLEASVSSRLGKDSGLKGKLVAEKADIAGLQLHRARLDFAGSLREQEVDSHIVGEFGRLQLRANISADPAWRAIFSDISLVSSSYGNWRQRDRAVVTLGEDGAVLEDFCAAEGPAVICLAGGLQTGGDAGWHMESRLTAVPLDLLNRSQLVNLPVSGALSGTLVLGGDMQRITFARADIAVPETDIQLDVEEEEFSSIHCRDAALTFDFADTLVHMNFTAQMKNGSRLAVLANTRSDDLLAAPLRSLPLSGSLALDNFDLAIFSALTGFGVEPTGRVNSSFTLAGTVGQPELAGRGSIEGGGIALPYQGIMLENVEVSVVAAEDGAKVVGQATSGPGKITVDGLLRYGDVGVEGDLAVASRDFLLVNLPEYAIHVNSDVQLLFARKRGEVKGTVEIPHAMITPEELKDSVQVSQDVILVSGRQEQRTAGWPFALDLDVVLGEDVRIQGHGLTGRLAGQLQVKPLPMSFPPPKVNLISLTASIPFMAAASISKEGGSCSPAAPSTIRVLMCGPRESSVTKRQKAGATPWGLTSADSFRIFATIFFPIRIWTIPRFSRS